MSVRLTGRIASCTTRRTRSCVKVKRSPEAASSCRPTSTLPTKSSPQYNELVRTFYIGLAALEVGHDVQADAKLAQFTQLAASEPAGWANWGLLALRQRNYDIAAERFNKARDLAPDNSQIFYLTGLLESSRGNTAEAINVGRT